jgi:acetolactate synthase-1/2/3 large subunit
MHGADVMVCIGARFDDRVTGRLDGFSPHSKKIHVDIDPSSINKNVGVDVAIVGDAEKTLSALNAAWQRRSNMIRRDKVDPWWNQIHAWQKVDSSRPRSACRSRIRMQPSCASPATPPG